MAEATKPSPGESMAPFWIGLVLALGVIFCLYFALFAVVYDAFLWRWEAIPALIARPWATIDWAFGVVNKFGFIDPIRGPMIGAGVLEALIAVGAYAGLKRLGLFKGKQRYSERRLRGARVLNDMAYGAAELIAYGSPKGMKVRHIERLAKKPWAKIVTTAHEQDMIRVGGLPMPHFVETEHTLITGSSGSGKSFLIAQTLHDLAKRGDRVICFDHGGAFRRQFPSVKAVSLSPAEDASPGWDLRNEIRAPHDWELLAASVVPEGFGASADWRNFARDLLANLGHNVGAQSSNAELLRLCTVADRTELAIALEGTAAAAHCSDDNKAFLASVRSTLVPFVSGWKYMKGGDFSLRHFIAEDTRWLWLPYDATNIAAHKTLLATWADILVTAGLERPDDAPPVWIVIDEMDALGALGRFRDAVSRLRKKGVRILVGVQSRTQLVELYGEAGADTVLASLSNRVIMRASDHRLAEWSSKTLGDVEVEETRLQRGTQTRDNPTSFASTKSNSETEIVQHRTKRAVMPEQISALSRGHGYVKFSQGLPTVRIWPQDMAA
ncbi:type IV secretion system DNA-binding domain-containing protein [Microvirga lotononidis]|uniref:Type IV secretory pathway, VirD4 component n=1 Tax=Microvirga lotononidis TaxID=864069 RepID=I4Z284_9HYPH|nr:type IV secretion system DNA-binding domain-containing protein [Microvirga lotononidis]EIM30326.1 type IV secretory pathway, VirD4 component [Microvirga lotononidis]